LFDKLVRSAPFFDAIPLDLIQSLVVSCQEEVYGPGQTIMRQGEVGSDLYFVMKGTANVFLNEEVIATKEVGDYFGEVGLVYDAPRTASVCAKSFTIVARLTRSSFVQVLQDATAECREDVTRRILDGCLKEDLFQTEKEDTPLLSAERDNDMSEAGKVFYRVSVLTGKSPRRSSSPTAPSPRGGALASPRGGGTALVADGASIERLEQRLDKLTIMMENGFARLNRKEQPRLNVAPS